MTEAELDQWKSRELAIACLRVETQAGKKLTPEEMIERVEQEAME